MSKLCATNDKAAKLSKDCLYKIKLKGQMCHQSHGQYLCAEYTYDKCHQAHYNTVPLNVTEMAENLEMHCMFLKPHKAGRAWLKQKRQCEKDRST